MQPVARSLRWLPTSLSTLSSFFPKCNKLTCTSLDHLLHIFSSFKLSTPRTMVPLLLALMSTASPAKCAVPASAPWADCNVSAQPDYGPLPHTQVNYSTSDTNHSVLFAHGTCHLCVRVHTLALCICAVCACVHVHVCVRACVRVRACVCHDLSASLFLMELLLMTRITLSLSLSLAIPLVPQRRRAKHITH